MKGGMCMATKASRLPTNPEKGLRVTDGRIVACIAFADCVDQLNDEQLTRLAALWRMCLADSLWWYQHDRLRRALAVVTIEIAARNRRTYAV